MAQPESSFGGCRVVQLEDGQEVAYYDPTEAVEEHAASQSTRTLGGLAVDDGELLESDENGRTVSNRSGRVVAVAKRGQEEIFAHLDFPAVLPVSASDPDEAMAHARRYLKQAGLKPGDFLSFDVTTHYYQAALGKRECGWSFSFHSNPFGPGVVRGH